MSVRVEGVEAGDFGLQGLSIVAVEAIEVLNCHIHSAGITTRLYRINLRANIPAPGRAYFQ